MRNIPGSFLLHGKPCTLVRPNVAATSGPRITASGSVADPTATAKIAKASRILVEGIHDAELVEKVWATTSGPRASWSSRSTAPMT